MPQERCSGYRMTLKKISDHGWDLNCTICAGEGLVCENHPGIPWGGGDGCCGGAGMPCTCNELHRDNWSEETIAHHKWCDEHNEKINRKVKK